MTLRSAWDDYWDDRPERVASRRAAFWNLYGRYTAVREKMTQDQKTMRRISGAIGVMGTPVAGAIAYAAMNVDKYIAPELSDLAGSEETIALIMIEELEADGSLTTREARNMARATIKALEEIKNTSAPPQASPTQRRPRTEILSLMQKGPGKTDLESPAPAAAPAPNYLPLALGALAVIFILRGS